MFVLQLVRKPLSILLIIAFLFQITSKVVFVAWFTINQTAIIETCCVNKNRPELNCKAKCFFEKHIREINDEGEIPASSNKSKVSFDELLYADVFAKSINPPYMLSSVIGCTYFIHYKSQLLNLVFHPPKSFC